MDVHFSTGAPAEITVDSAAEDSVCPHDWGSQYGLQDASEWMHFVNASGGKINRDGQREVLVSAKTF